jgi:hypothetical protein
MVRLHAKGQRGAAVLTACVGCGLVLQCSPPSIADPLPMDAPWSGGQVMPAAAVPVDMVSEDLRAVLSPLPEANAYQGPRSLCRADVQVEYVLRADDKVTVPVLFPFVLGAEEVEFKLNGHAVEARLIDDLEFLKPYEPAWRKVIDDTIAGDRALAQIAADAAADMGESRQASAAGASEQKAQGKSVPDDRVETVHIFTRLQPQLAARLEQLGHPTTDSLLWGLSHYLIGDWQERWRPRTGRPAADADLVERTRLWATRCVAVALDPQAPDPVALWDVPPFAPTVTEMSFAVGLLRLKAGENRFTVSYRQNTSFVNRRLRDPKRPEDGRHRQVSDFRFILQTARFWRSFGDLRIDVQLPEGTTFAECSLPGAQVDSADAPRRVTYAGAGLPATNLSVLSAGFAVAPPDAPNSAEGDVPAVQLRLRWQAAVSRDFAFAHAAPAADTREVVAAVDGRAALYSRATGEEVQVFGYEGSPYGLALLPDRVLIGMSRPSGHGYAEHASVMSFDRKTGEHQWTAEMPPGSGRAFGTCPIVAGDKVVAWADRHSVFAARLADGAVLWQKRFGCRAVALSEEARAGDERGLVFVGGRGSPESTDLKEKAGWVFAAPLGTGKVAWSRQLGDEVVGLGLVGDAVYAIVNVKGAGAPFIAVLGARDGDVRAKHELQDRRYGFNYVWDVLPRDGRLLIVSDAAVHAYDLNRPTKPLWEMRYSLQGLSAPAIDGDSIYVGSTRGLLKGDMRTGRWLWRAKPAGDPVAGPCSARDGVVFAIRSLGGVLTAWQADAPAAATEAPLKPPFGRPPDDLREQLGLTGKGGSRTGAIAVPTGIAVVLVAGLMLVRRRRRAP